MIFVMGEGLVLEQGTHNELLNDENSAYARLVAAQKLRESQQRTEGDSEDVAKEAEEMEKAVREEIPLGRKNTGQHSLASELIDKRLEHKKEQESEYSLIYLFKRIGLLHRVSWKNYFLGSICAIGTGCVYPSFGIVYCASAFVPMPPDFLLFAAKGIVGFSLEGHARRIAGDRNALWCVVFVFRLHELTSPFRFFIIAIASSFLIGFQSYLFGSSAATLAKKLRSLSFRAILRQDSALFPHVFAP
jgi:ATP-binding cassette subfamily B (MDR/TAP) protein 1